MASSAATAPERRSSRAIADHGRMSRLPAGNVTHLMKKHRAQPDSSEFGVDDDELVFRVAPAEGRR